MAEHVDLAVVGAGISGLAAAWEGHRRGARVVVVDASPGAGGKLRTATLAGAPVDEAADAFLARVPDAVDLCNELGIESELVAPGTGTAHVWLDGALRRVPPDQLLGVPTDLDAVAASGLLSPAGVERARRDLTLPDDRPAGDESVGELIRRRLGAEVLDRLVAPLVGSIYAGDCDRLSLEVSAAQLAAARDLDPKDPSLIRAAVALRNQAANTGRPVFLAPVGGMARLVGALTDGLGDAVRLGTAVTAVEPAGAGWRIAPLDVIADAVVVTAPAFAAHGLVRPLAPEAADVLAGIDYASVTLVGLAVPRDGIDHALDGSGLLVPRSAGLLLTACSWFDQKWPHVPIDPGLAVLRASVGHDGDDRARTLPDDAIVAGVLADLETTMGLRAAPVEVRVTRWERSFPQPRPGHLGAMARADDALAARSPRLAATGAWARGVGIPACIRAARAAAARVVGATTEP
ncbi:MAG TPA: protoporphyrinogen oxidase [Acidimicrobiales bacterium]|nr:protoporphyrinogen oxidase [Acidimicrobiales bacterium]